MFLETNSKGAAKVICSFILFFWISSIGIAYAQNRVHQQLYWTRINLQSQVSDKWQVNAEVDNRRFMDPDRQQQIIFQTQALYTIRPGILGGTGVSLSWVYTPTKSGTMVVPEIRPFQSIVVTQPLSTRLILQHRYRIDERFFHKHDGIRLTEGYRFNWRFAYQAQLSYPVVAVKPGSFLKISNDIMVNAGKNIASNFDQYRFYAGFEYPITPHWATEAGYMYIYQQGRQNLLVRDVLRLTIFGRFGGARYPR
ncbi:DUF2490 domain-containing protein [Telluribacter sp. SYSU D00476]|uniref:DUF2490 domain-containing protein n=1 Tax=Telluribacter sp. SYSU D00476 TaxID=2811430 RepID=UPI0021D4316B|nr:DUF2490 domain-containing protein [Telluribacter sp. SYSU D00476]